jgi:hypothetical protein
MIRIAITEAALVAIAKTLPEGTVLHVDRRRGQCFIHLKEAIVRLRHRRSFRGQVCEPEVRPAGALRQGHEQIGQGDIGPNRATRPSRR